MKKKCERNLAQKLKTNFFFRLKVKSWQLTVVCTPLLKAVLHAVERTLLDSYGINVLMFFNVLMSKEKSTITTCPRVVKLI